MFLREWRSFWDINYPPRVCAWVCGGLGDFSPQPSDSCSTFYVIGARHLLSMIAIIRLYNFILFSFLAYFHLQGKWTARKIIHTALICYCVNKDVNPTERPHINSSHWYCSSRFFFIFKLYKYIYLYLCLSKIQLGSNFCAYTALTKAFRVTIRMLELSVNYQPDRDSSRYHIPCVVLICYH